MNHQKVLLGLLALVMLSFTVILPDPFLRFLKSGLDRYQQTFPQEKVYVHTDKTFYKPGEDIWFNTYVLHPSMKPSHQSHLVYVELIDPKGNIKEQLTLNVNEGTARGDFGLGSDIRGGIYTIKAYTNWMKNFPEAKVFEKKITIQRVITPRLLLTLDFEKEAYGPGSEVTAILQVRDIENQPASGATIDGSLSIDGKVVDQKNKTTNEIGLVHLGFRLPENLSTTDGILQLLVYHKGVSESISRSVPIVLNQINVQFFPEGGYLLQDALSKVAFKATNEFGKAADIKAVLVNETGEEIQEVNSYHMGMGSFDFIPQGESQYALRVIEPKGIPNLYTLPKATHQSYHWHTVKQTEGSLDIRISAPTTDSVFVVARSQDEILYSKRILLLEGQNKLHINTKQFPNGIAVFTLFDKFKVARRERLYFINPQKHLNITIKTNKEQYMPREQVKVTVTTTDHLNNPVKSKLSAAVVNDQLISFADDKQDNLLSWMLLSSDLKGNIQEPSFYFDPEEEKAPLARDLLMQIHGWRRIHWEEILEPQRSQTYKPDKLHTISGRVTNHRKSEGLEIALLELGNQRRMAQIETDENGYFHFRNFDPSVSVLLATKKPGHITLSPNSKPAYKKTSRRNLNTSQDDDLARKYTKYEKVNHLKGNREKSVTVDQQTTDLLMDEDVESLSEIVVTGYGIDERRNLTSSVVTIHGNELTTAQNSNKITDLLQGRIRGVSIQNSGSENAFLSLYGSASITSSEPLYVIDGVVANSDVLISLSRTYTGTNDIQSIAVLKGTEATALYGTQGSQGVVVITTKSGIRNYGYYYNKKREGKYRSQLVTPRAISTTREFYAPIYKKKTTSERSDFRSTLFWSPSLVTDENGQAEYSFYNNDEITSFRIISEGFSINQTIGRQEYVYSTSLPLAMDLKLPEYVGLEDTVSLAVRIANNTNETKTGTLKLEIPEGLKVVEGREMPFKISAKSNQYIHFSLIPEGVLGNFPLEIQLKAGSIKDVLQHELIVQAIGFPVAHAVSGTEGVKEFELDIDNFERNSLYAELTLYPNVMSDLMEGIESMLREPHGCFEQVSSSTYPNILALQLIQQGKPIPKIEKKARHFIEQGYRKLKSYEIDGGGFEWFGRPAAHEALSAYGLIEFQEMKKVYPKVSQALIDRTKAWLLSRRDGSGGFHQNKGKYGFSSASSEVNNAYIVFALTEAGETNITLEYQTAKTEATYHKDFYRMALLAIAAKNLGLTQDYEDLVGLFEAHVKKNGLTSFKADHSVVRSYGYSLNTEIVAIWSNAIMKDKSMASEKFGLLDQCIKYLLSKRKYGRYGSTQATGLALQALANYSSYVQVSKEGGTIEILVNNHVVESLKYEVEEDNIKITGLEKYLKEGKQIVQIQYKDTGNPLPYTLDYSWRTKLPSVSSDLCAIDLKTSMNSEEIKVNETVRLVTTITNKKSTGQPMTIAVIGIPGGLSVQPWQLKELQEKKVFDFYEIIGDRLAIYYRELGPNAIREINLDLKAEIPGTYEGAASNAYLYYTDEYKHWVAGNKIRIIQP